MVHEQSSRRVRSPRGSFPLAWCVGVLAAILAGPTAGFGQARLSPVQISVPPVRGFFSKYVDCGGIFVRAAKVVEDRALELACSKLMRMLSRATRINANMVEWQAELHVIGRDQKPSDLPELRSARETEWDSKSHQNVDQRTRGVGGLYSSCGEENLLGLPTDRYAGGSDICVHEFAHGVMAFGIDDMLRKGIQEQFLRATSAGLWKGRYAATNAQEYWAELSMWYFGAHGDRGDNGPAPGSTALAAYDPGGYALLDGIYSGTHRPLAVNIAPVRAVDGSTQPRSGNSAAAASLVLINNSSRSYAVGWLDFNGQPKGSYGKLEPMSYREMKTFVTHAWVLTDTDSGRANKFIVSAPASRWRIDE